MRPNVLFVQGAGARAYEFDALLVRSLEEKLGAEYDIHFPQMPNESDARYPVWKAELFELFSAFGDGTVLVGHSVGGTVLINTLSETHPKFSPAAIMLISAPFVGNGGWPSDDIDPHPDMADRIPSGIPVHLFHGTKDEIVPFSHAELYKHALPDAILHPLSNRDHQLNNDLTEVAAEIRSLRSRDA